MDMKSTARLRGVVFDMDGVLVESEPFIMEASSRMFAEKGYTIGHAEFKPFVGMGEDRFIGGPAEKFGIKLDPARDKARTYEIYLDIIKGKLKPLSGAVELVYKCRDRGFKLAVASSADRIKVEGNLRELGIPAETFAAIVTGDDVARKKPAPDIFLEAIRRLGVEPASCLIVEDAVAGVAAAKAAGSKCLAVTSTFPPEKLAAADWIVTDLRNVSDQVLSW